MIKPQPGYGLAYIDWSQQEFAIAAVLSGDTAMQEAYLSGDPYLAFGIQAGKLPKDATKETHKTERGLFKQCVLAVQYGMGYQSLAFNIGGPNWVAKELLDLHHKTYSTFWKWNDAVVAYANMEQYIWTKFDWRYFITQDTAETKIRNFPMQSHGAEMLRLACCFATENDIRICAPVHDAILIEARVEDLGDAIEKTKGYMAQASRVVLDGFEAKVDHEPVRYPERYMDERGEEFWNTVWSVIATLEGGDIGRE